MAEPTNKLKRDRWTAADRAAMAVGCAMAVVVFVAGFVWWMSLDAAALVLAGLVICAVVIFQVVLGLLAALLDVIRRP